MIEPLAVGLHAVKKAGNIVGQTVVVVGAGTIGLCTIMCAKAAGAGRIIALEMSSARKKKALEVGANVVIDPKECDAIAEVKALTGGYGADVSFECIGNKATAKLAIDVIRKAGKCVMVGIFEEPSAFNFFEIVSTEKEIIGSLAYNGEFADVIRFIADGRIDVQPLITGRISSPTLCRTASKSSSTTRTATSRSSSSRLPAGRHDSLTLSRSDGPR